MQHLVDNIQSLNSNQLNELLIALARVMDARACVYVIDVMKAQKVNLSQSALNALRIIERDRGVHVKNVHVVPVPDRATLDPVRRIHKVLKGKRMSERSSLAKEHVDAAIAWVRAQPHVDARSSARARMNVAKSLANHMNISLEVARGVVALLKRKGKI